MAKTKQKSTGKKLEGQLSLLGGILLHIVSCSKVFKRFFVVFGISVYLGKYFTICRVLLLG